MKRQSKKDRRAVGIAALRRRMLDMAFGAFGFYIGAEAIDPVCEDHNGMFAALGPEAISRWIGSVAVHLIGVERDGKAHHLIQPHCLDGWDNLDELAEKLYDAYGVRA